MAQTVRVEGMAQLRRTMRRAGADLSDLTDMNMAAAPQHRPAPPAACPGTGTVP